MNAITLYIVDDCLLTRIANRKYFESVNSIKLAGDFSCAEDCLEKMQKAPADVVLTEIDLPWMNGIEITKLIKEKYPKTKVIILTFKKSEELVLASFACGACGYILKNNPDVDLKKIIEMTVKGQIWLDLETAGFIFSTIPCPNTHDLENLYENKNLKNSLTARELEVLKLLTDGKTNSQIAKEIIVSTNTAKAHVGSILTKLSVTDRVQAAVKAVRSNLF